ncbi:MAG: thiol reductant ABC exporter subunit CydC [Actinomycetota bacterium]
MSDRQVLARLLRLARPERRRLALSMLLGFATVGASIGLMATSGFLISYAALRPPVLELIAAVVGVRAFGVSRGVLRYLERLASHDAAFRLLADLRVAVYERLEALAPAGLERRRRGDLLSRLVDDVDELQTVFIRGIAPPVVAAGVLVLATGLLAAFLPSAALVLAAALLGAGLGVSLLALRLGRAAQARLAAARGLLATEVVGLLEGAGELLAYGRVDDALAEVDAADAELVALERAGAWRAGLVAALGTLVSGGAVWLVAVVGVPAVAAGELAGYHLALVVLTAMAAFEATTPLPAAAQELSGALAAARRVLELTDAPDPVTEPAAPRPAPSGRELRVEDARLRYAPDGPPALDGVDLTLARGRRVALVGPSGAGKTSLAHVALRFRDLDGGRALLDGVDLAAYAAADVRRVIGLVEQDAHLFDTTIGANVRLGRPDAGDDEVADALARARLADWVASLPDGLDTPVGEEGVRVSAGQRQRIALARALLVGAPLLILDEPTANVDRTTARALRRQMLEAAEGRGVLLITHDLPEPDEVDEVVVLEAGRVVERGRPGELLAAGGRYRAMADLAGLPAAHEVAPPAAG